MDAHNEVMDALATLRPKIKRTKERLDALYAEQNALYVKGHEQAVPIAWMARAGGEKYAIGDQSVRDVIRRHQATEANIPARESSS